MHIMPNQNILKQNKNKNFFLKINSVVILLLLCMSPILASAATVRVSLADDESEPNASAGTLAISSGGRYTAFLSAATNIVTGDSNASNDVFVRDNLLGTTERVSVATDGTQQNAGSSATRVVITPDGRYVLFLSSGTNLVAGDTNGRVDAFLRDRQLGTTEMVSMADDESLGNGNVITGATLAMTPDGRYIAFQSGATNLVAGDSNGVTDVFLRDRTSGTTEMISIATGGTIENGAARTGLAISDDGRYVAFQSAGTNLVAGDTNAGDDTFVRDRTLATTERVSIADDESQSSGGSNITGATVSISSDGRYVTFVSAATNLVTGDSNAVEDVFVRDRTSGTTERVSIADNESQATAASGAGVVISDTGRYVTFYSSATNLVTGDTNGVADIFVRDRTSGSTRIVSIANDDSLANAGVTSGHTAMSPNGTYIGFISAATNLVSGDTNAVADAFIQYVSGGADTTPPSISDVASTTGITTATITWSTNESASSSVRYGLTTSYGTVSSSTGSTTHSVNLSGLTANTLYHFSILAVDPSGNIATTTDYTFTTLLGAPTITNVSSDKANGTYGPGEVIDIDVTFSEAVTSTGSVTVTLETGTTDRTCTFTVSNSTTGTCNYTVQSGDTTADLTVSSVSGTIKDSDDISMVNFTPATNLHTNKDIVIDGIAPGISSIASSTLYTTATIDWTTDESANSRVSYGLVSGTYTNSSSSATLRTSQSISLSGLAESTKYYFVVISTDAYGNTATSSEYFFTTNQSPDITAPVVSNIASTTGETTATITWTTNESASTTVQYGLTASYGSSAATSTGTTSHSASLSGLTADTLYHFRIIARDRLANSTSTVDYTFRTNAADTASPVLLSFTSATPNGTYGTGQNINITATFDEALGAGSTMSVYLDTGVIVTLDNISGNTLYGTYTVEAGHSSLDLNIELLISSSITDSIGNTGNADFPPSSLADTSAIVIDTTVVSTPPPETNNQNAPAAPSASFAYTPWLAPSVILNNQVKNNQNKPSLTNLPATSTIKIPINKDGVCSPYLTKNIKAGANNDSQEVIKLQKFLNEFENANIALSGVYDKQTQDAIGAFQSKYSVHVLAPWGLKSATGYVYQTTRAKINAMVCAQNVGCQYFNEYHKLGSNSADMSKVKSFLNLLDETLTLNTSSHVYDNQTFNAVKSFQNRYKDAVLKPWGLTSATGYWYKTTRTSANSIMGCIDNGL